MVQVLPYIPSFAEKLTPALASGISSTTQFGINKYQKQQRDSKDAEIFQQLENDDLSPVQKMTLVSKLSPERAKILTTLYAPVLKEQEKGNRMRGLIGQFLPEFDAQFKGGYEPQQEGDPQNIKPSTSMPAPNVGTPGQLNPSEIRDRQGLSLGNETQALPGMTGKQSFNPQDVSTWPENILVRASGLKGLGGEGAVIAGMAESELSRRQAEKTQGIQQRKLNLQEANAQRSAQEFEATHKLNLAKFENQITQFLEDLNFRKDEAQRHAKEFSQKFQFDQGQAENKKTKEEEEIQRKPFEKSTEQFFTTLEEERQKVPSLDLSLQSMTDAVLRGDVDPWSAGHVADIAKDLGAPESLVKPLESPGSKQFRGGLKSYLASTLKDAFRGATTGKEIQLAESLLASVGTSREANLAALWLLQSQKMITEEKIRLADQLKDEGVKTYDIPAEVNKRLVPYRKDISKQYLDAIRTLSKK